MYILLLHFHFISRHLSQINEHVHNRVKYDDIHTEFFFKWWKIESNLNVPYYEIVQFHLMEYHAAMKKNEVER